MNRPAPYLILDDLIALLEPLGWKVTMRQEPAQFGRQMVVYCGEFGLPGGRRFHWQMWMGDWDYGNPAYREGAGFRLAHDAVTGLLRELQHTPTARPLSA